MQQQNNNKNKMDLKKIDWKKVKEIKYKILIFVILLASYLFYPYLVSLYSEVRDLQNQIVAKQKLLENKQKELADLKLVKKEIDIFEKNKWKIVNCINNWKCEDLKLSSKDKLIAKAYFMFSKYKKTVKMDYNQKEVLSDILTFLQNRGSLNVVSFWSLTKIKWISNVYVLPLTLNVDFSSYNKFIDFLKTVEKKVYPQKVKNLYLIKNVSYDILEYNKPQTVTVNMDLYFYK